MIPCWIPHPWWGWIPVYMDPPVGPAGPGLGGNIPAVPVPTIVVGGVPDAFCPSGSPPHLSTGSSGH